MEKDIIHENSNNHNKYINNENSGEKSAKQAGAVLRAMTVDDISAVKQIEQTCFSDAWSEKLLSDLLASGTITFYLKRLTSGGSDTRISASSPAKASS